eukprot:3846121-Rhodomonas_salina.2
MQIARRDSADDGAVDHGMCLGAASAKMSFDTLERTLRAIANGISLTASALLTAQFSQRTRLSQSKHGELAMTQQVGTG